MNSDFEKIVCRCKASVFLTVNDHKSIYQDLLEYIGELRHRDGADEISDEQVARILESKTLYSLQFYPDTPIGFYRVYGSTLPDVIEQALAILNKGS